MSDTGTGTTGGGGSTTSALMQFLNSPAGAALISGAGAAASAAGQNRANAEQQNANRQLSANQFAAQMGQQMLESDRQNQLSQASAAAAASPLGESQSFAQRNAMLSAILPSLRNSSYSPGDSSVAQAMGTNSGGLRLPEGGLDPAMIQRMFGDNATLASIQQRQAQVGQLNPNGPVMDLSPMYGQSGMNASNQILSSNRALFDQQSANEAKQRQAIMQAIDNNIAQEGQVGPNGKPPDGYEYDKKTGQLKKKGSSVWKKIAKGAIIGGAALATAYTGGAASPLLTAAIGAGAGAGVGAIDNGWKGAALGAGLGAATGGLGGGGAGGAGGSIAKNVVNSTARNPAFYGAILGR